jgi:hypothetical protein
VEAGSVEGVKAADHLVGIDSVGKGETSAWLDAVLEDLVDDLDAIDLVLDA